MARKAGGRSGARAAAADSGEGLLAGIVDRVFEDPARSGGLMVVAMTATAIVCNAMFLQNAHRPAPLFQMRPSPNSAPVAVPLPKPAPNFPAAPLAVQPVQSVAPPQMIAPPLPRLAPVAKSAAGPAAPPATAVPQPTPAQQLAALVTEIQRGLARLGLYTGTIDGKTSGRTSAAIAKYEEAAGLKATGQPTPELLYALQHPTAAPAAGTAPAADPIATQLDQSAQRRAASIAADTDAANARAAAATKAAQAKAVQAQAAAVQQAAKAAEQNKAVGTYRTVQTALNRIGYGPLPVDGTANAATVDAIRGFELDNGLPVSGAPSQALIDRLVTIGAIKPN